MGSWLIRFSILAAGQGLKRRREQKGIQFPFLEIQTQTQEMGNIQRTPESLSSGCQSFGLRVFSAREELHSVGDVGNGDGGGRKSVPICDRKTESSEYLLISCAVRDSST